MNYFDKDKINISGPTNVVRLEGQIAGINKVLYLFMDYHMPPGMETECSNIYTKDVKQYFTETFQKLNDSDKMYDFIIETRPSEIYPPAQFIDSYMKRKDIYIVSIIKLFAQLFNFDKDKNQVKISDVFKNIRLHYLDVRDYIGFQILYNLVYEINNKTYYLSMCTDCNIEIMNGIIVSLKNLKQELDKFNNIFKQSDKSEDGQEIQNKKHVQLIKTENTSTRSCQNCPPVNEPNNDATRQIINKLRNRYNHNEIKAVINKLIDNIIEKLSNISQDIEEITKIINNFANLLFETKNKLIKNDKPLLEYTHGLSSRNIRLMINEIYDMAYYIQISILHKFSEMTDLFFLRRFLDKDYITNAIVYSGAYHSQNYIKILVQEFNFKITHYSYSAIQDINQLNNEIKNRDPSDLLSDLFDQGEILQCSDLTTFPKNFL